MLIHLSRSWAIVAGITAAYLIPAAIPGFGLDYPYLFIMGLVLMAWFTIKWKSVKELTQKGGNWEIASGAAIIAADYAQNIIAHSPLGLIDMIVIFAALVMVFYGIRSFRLFWVPSTYGIVLLLGYQLGNIAPDFVALQDWMASLMASSMQLLGIQATVSGHIVAMDSSYGPLLLNVEGDCTGVQGILAFGMLSTMAVLDMKAKLSRIIPLFVIGFVGAFLINIVRLMGVFLAFEYLGIDIGTSVHVYLGYLLFIAWVMVFWTLAFRYLIPGGVVVRGPQALQPGTPRMP